MKFFKKTTRIYNPGLRFPTKVTTIKVPKTAPEMAPPYRGNTIMKTEYGMKIPKRKRMKKKRRRLNTVSKPNMNGNMYPYGYGNTPWAPRNRKSVRRNRIATITPQTGETTRSFCTKTYSKRKNMVQRAQPNTQLITGDYTQLWTSISGRKEFHQLGLMTTRNEDQFGRLGPTATEVDPLLQPSFQSLTNQIHLIDPPDYTTDDKKTLDYFYSLGTLTNRVHLTNTSNSRVVLTIRNLVCRRDLPTKGITFNASTTGPLAGPIGAMCHGWRMRQVPNAAQSPTSENTVFDNTTVYRTSAFTQAVPSQSTTFNYYYKIRKTTKIILAPGSSHIHTTTVKFNKLMNPLHYMIANDLRPGTIHAAGNAGYTVDKTNLDDVNLGVGGVTCPILFEFHSVPAIDSTNNEVNMPPTTLGVSSKFSLSYSYLKKRSRSITYNTVLRANVTDDNFRVFSNVEEQTVDTTLTSP